MICEQCGKRVYNVLLPIDIQEPNGFTRKQVCVTCYEKRQRELEQCRINFNNQFGGNK